MILTERDVKILRFINDFGFCELRQIMRYFDINQSNAYKIMKRLCKHELVRHERLYLRKPGVYQLSRQGAAYTELPSLKKLPESLYQHQLKIVDVFIQLQKLHLGSYWLSERHLLKNRTREEIKKKIHIPDGMLIFPDKKPIAIEVELTLKAEKRLDKILRWYAGKFDIESVWYYCNPQVMSTLQKLTAKRSFICIHNLEEFLNGQ